MSRSVERILKTFDAFYGRVFDHAVMGTALFEVTASHPREALNEIRRCGIGRVYRNVWRTNKYLL